MEKRFIGKVVVVTGGASGIGKQTTRQFAEEGARVASLDYNFEGVEATAEELNKEGYDVTPYFVNLYEEESVDSTFKAVEEKHGTIDVLANCAGVISFEPFDEATAAEFDRVMNVNIRGTYLCTRNASQIMKKHETGAIVMVSSGAAKLGGHNVSTAYCCSKGAINSLTYHFARKLAPYHVRVNAIQPGPINTPMLAVQAELPGNRGNGLEPLVEAVPFGMGYPEDIANAILFLSDNVMARYISGDVIDVDGAGHLPKETKATAEGIQK